MTLKEHCQKYLDNYKGDGKFLASEAWIVSGMDGGDCYNNSPRPIGPQDPEEFYILEKILLEVCPELSFSDYVKHIKPLIVIKEYTNSYYYGNREDYNYHAISIEDLEETLNILGYQLNFDIPLPEPYEFIIQIEGAKEKKEKLVFK